MEILEEYGKLFAVSPLKKEKEKKECLSFKLFVCIESSPFVFLNAGSQLCFRFFGYIISNSISGLVLFILTNTDRSSSIRVHRVSKK